MNENRLIGQQLNDLLQHLYNSETVVQSLIGLIGCCPV